MSTPLQVSHSFVTEFSERLAKNPGDLGEMYGHNSTVHINDFELGNTEATGADVPNHVIQWAAIVEGSQITVESVNAAPVSGGVNVFVTATSVGPKQQHYFQFNTSLELYSGFTMEGYYIRHQVISRIGAVAVQAPAPVAVPAAVPEPVVEAPAVAAPVPVAPAAKKEKTPKAEAPAKEEPKKEKKAAAPVEVPAAVVEPVVEKKSATPEPAAEQAAAPTAPSKPKSWASLASTTPKGAMDNSKAVRVVAPDTAAAAKAAEPAAAAAPKAAEPAETAKAPKAEREPKREKKPAEPVGDRLMFNIDHTVTDEDIKAALGATAAHLVSLRNNSARGHVFIDFAEEYKAFDELRKINPSIGKAKISVYRQRTRD